MRQLGRHMRIVPYKTIFLLYTNKKQGNISVLTINCKNILMSFVEWNFWINLSDFYSENKIFILLYTIRETSSLNHHDKNTSRSSLNSHDKNTSRSSLNHHSKNT